MKVYLMQHGHPLSKEEDPQRALSAKGRKDVDKVGRFLQRAGVEVQEVFHSGKTRARQTAEIVAARLGTGRNPEAKEGLSPTDDVAPIARQIEKGDGDLFFLGHLPHLGRLVTLLIAGEQGPSMVRFQQGGVLCLQRDDDTGRWAVAWMIVPEIIAD